MIGIYSSLASLLFALLCTSVGQLLFRMYYVRTKKIYLVASLGMFLVVPVLSYFALVNLTLAFVYMSTALTHVLVLIMSHMFLKEHLTRKQYLSMSLIVVGIITFNL
ncbi:MAG: EamA family transporter [Proteobacteria bacterium]|nr:EamA family transporter [Pseudomonadota bacterium]